MSIVGDNISAGITSHSRDNLDVLSNFHDRETAELSALQIIIEKVSSVFGSPGYFVAVVAFILGWIALNTWGWHAAWPHYDRPPFFWLQGIVSANALLLTMSVLIRQNRMARLAEHRAHLDLQINLLTEQKVTKILSMIDGLRAGSTASVPPTRSQTEVEEMAKPANAEALLQAIKQVHDDKAS